MSNAIRDTEKLNQRQIETAKRRNEREIKTINTNHENYKADLQKTHAQEIVDIQNEHHMHMSNEADRKEKVLADMRNHLQQTKDLTEKELKSLATLSDKEKNAIREKFSQDRQRINAENELYLEDMNDRFNQSSRKISYDGKNRMEDMKHSMNEQFLETKKFHESKLQNATEEFTTRFRTDGRKYEDLKYQQDTSFKKERLSTNLRQQNEMKKMTEVHTNHLEQKDQNYRKGLKDQDLFFEKKYAGQFSTHNEQYKRLEDKNKKLVEDLKTSLTKEITKTSDRNNDPFFKFETLKPKLKSFEDRVEISVEIPEHSKQDVQLTFNGKEAIISFNRRFADASKEVDGTINKINKVETFTSRLQTGTFLNAKTMKSSYENGVMTYVVQKA